MNAALLEAANKELEAFSYSVSHDLRAPLRHIDGFVGMLTSRAESKLDDKEKHYLNTIIRSVKRMGTLIDDLLAFSRIARTEIRIGPVNLNQLVSECRQELEPETSKRTVEWHCAALPTVQGDRALLKQVLANLLGNAVKYSRDRNPAVIKLECSETASDYTVVVRDNGVGFDMKYVDKLFGVFQRLHSNTAFEGTGIGLANVSNIVKRFGGTVKAEGQLEKGASFFFTLPKTSGKT
jgi:light-regulated signal transduction histidine kinase (bacteriophytochrome)